MGNNYDGIAGYYNFLSRLVFQKSIVNAQVFLLNHIPANSKVLIVGGGTGWVLEALSKIHNKGIEITYAEKSAKMIALSKQKNTKNNNVEFINNGIEDFSTEKKFDVIFTAFLFDNFQPAKIEMIFTLLNQSLKPKGLWLYADFMNNENTRLWQKVFLKLMYLFFKITCNIETQQLVDMKRFFSDFYSAAEEKYFYANFIKAVAYIKKT